MRRREFITLLGGATSWPLAARAQQRPAPRHIGVLMGFVEHDREGEANAAAFIEGLGALNWKEGSNLHIDWRWGDSDPTLMERYAAELVALSPDLLLAGCGRPGASRGVLSFSLRSPLTEPPSAIDVAYWPISEVARCPT
jgi:putative ABC transport system substrate-binding protein